MIDTHRSTSSSENSPSSANRSSVSKSAKGGASKAGIKRLAGAKSVKAARKAIEDGTETVRHQATAAFEASAHAVDTAPLSALAGAIALGAVAAALIPNSTRELQALRPLGDRVRGALDVAFSAAKTAGAEQLTARGLTAAATTSGVGALLGSIVKAVLAANDAAKDSLEPTKTDVKNQSKT
ncbi:hypothetical protein BH09PSE3_BH09PSE3_07770 [soil metagenome]